MATSYIDFYSQHVEDLKKEGSQYMGWCPFHPDKGSKQKGFSVNPDNGLWICFSCGTGGNSINFCQKKGMDTKEAPDHDPGYHLYSYGVGISKKKPKPELKTKGGKNEFWVGTEGEGLPNDMKPFNHQAINQARKLKRTLWICEGEKDTLTMMDAGELAVGIPSATTDKVLDAVSLDGIHKVIIACDNDDAGKKATERILKRFPWALKIEWDQNKTKGYDVTDLKNEMGENFIKSLEKLVVDNDPFYPLTEVLMDKHERDQARDPDKLLGYTLQKFKTLAKNIDGVQPGFYIVGAETNTGKTAFLCNFTLDLLDSNDELTGIYFSLDDNKDTILNRFLSINTDIPLNQVQRPQKTDKHKEMLQKGYDYLFKMAEDDRLSLRDASEIQDIDALELEIKRRMNRPLFVVIDGLYNLDVGGPGADIRKENIERANKLKNLADVYRIPVICTGELRKKDRGASADRTPSIDDLMETGKFAYNANLVLLIYPEKWEDYNAEDEPTLNLKYAKNKLSHVRKTDKIKFIRKTSQIKEVSEERF